MRARSRSSEPCLARRWPSPRCLTLAHDTAGSPEQIMAVNVLGTWHVLLAAEAAGMSRVIHFSSAQVFGIAEGERLPDYFPVDDAHPRRATRPYGLSKCSLATAGRGGRSKPVRTVDWSFLANLAA